MQWNLEKLQAYCKSKWGVVPEESFLSREFGGNNIHYASNIVFSNGHIHPWCTGGVQFSLSDTLVALNYQDGAHHADLMTPFGDDPQAVKDARKSEIELIRTFLYSSARSRSQQIKLL